MALSIGISAEIRVRVGDVEGIELPDGTILPFDTQMQEIWVIHPDETKSGTCDDCAALAGEIFDVNEGEIPPMHANCVCERVPVVETYDPRTGEWISPDQELSIPMSKLDNMDDDALDVLAKQSEVDEKTIKRAQLILKRRRGKK